MLAPDINFFNIRHEGNYFVYSNLQILQYLKMHKTNRRRKCHSFTQEMRQRTGLGLDLTKKFKSESHRKIAKRFINSMER